jgi:hypothetical protein
VMWRTTGITNSQPNEIRIKSAFFPRLAHGRTPFPTENPPVKGESTQSSSTRTFPDGLAAGSLLP